MVVAWQHQVGHHHVDAVRLRQDSYRGLGTGDMADSRNRDERRDHNADEDNFQQSKNRSYHEAMTLF